MKGLSRPHLLSAVIGGVIAAVPLLILGVTGHRTMRTVVEEAPIDGSPASNRSSGLTPNEIYIRDAPGVVFVRAQVIEQIQDPFDLFPQQQSSVSTGSGFLIDRAGHILTNFHVIEGADRRTGVTVQFEGDVSRHATVVGQDPDNDLALLKVAPGGVPEIEPLALGDSTSVRVGDPTLAIGNPFGLDRTLTSGIVSALQRQIAAPNGFSIDNVIQTDAPINPGNSGGPLLDAAGRVIGINSQIETAGDGAAGSVGIAFAVPINTAKRFLPRLETGGSVQLAYLGVGGAPAPDRRGVLVRSVQPGGPAAGAGLRPGDEVRTIGGQRVSSMGDVQALVESRVPGAAVTIRAIRRGRALALKAHLGIRTAKAPAG
jgi:S1-C subfamily serine protease